VLWRVEVSKTTADAEAAELLASIRDLGVRGVSGVRITRLFYLQGDLNLSQVRSIACELLADPVSERFEVRAGGVASLGIEILFNPGVMDPSVQSVDRALRDAGFSGVEVRTGRAYEFVESGAGARRQSESVRRLVTRELLMNRVIQHVAAPSEQVFVKPRPYRFRRRIVRLLGLGPAELDRLSREGLLALSRPEMRVLQRHYAGLGRDPTDVELETFAQSWSEHCQHKTFRGRIDADGRTIKNLLKATVFRVTRELAPSWCLSVFDDNSGVVEFDDKWGVSFKVETHNHPSALEPYGGAATGIGGVIRDCLGTGLGAKPILNTDVFCFAPIDVRPESIPAEVLHPRRVMKGVVAGVRDYGNRMGIPTANGAVYFDAGFAANPLVFCGTLGLIPRDRLKKRVRMGQAIVLLGGRTGRDGIHGVTFASLELDQQGGEATGGAVQIGNPIEEKKVADVVIAARDSGLFSAITDCGGGGLSSAVGEMARRTGCEVWLDRVPLKYAGLSPAEIWISEAQERMVMFVEPDKVAQLLALASSHDVEGTVIGRVTDSRRIVLRYRRHTVADIDAGFLDSGWKAGRKIARWKKPEAADPAVPLREDLSEQLLKLLQSPNIASKEWVFRQYDHEVQAGTVVKPYCGIDGAGTTDACVVRPVAWSDRGCVVACGLCPRYGLIDPYWMAASAIDEALRNCVAAGADPARVGLLDNFCWGSPERPDLLAGLVRAAEACYDVASTYRVPFISGKDSLYNEYRNSAGEAFPIPSTLLVSAVGVIADVGRAMTPVLKSAGDIIYVVGETFEELGGSEYFRVNQGLGRDVPKVNVARGRRTLAAMAAAIARGCVSACHDVSEGGLGVALAEMTFGSGLGMEVGLRRVPGARRFRRDDFLLFSESNSRFVCTVPPAVRSAFERTMGRVAHVSIGRVRTRPEVLIDGLRGVSVVRLGVGEATAAWRRALGRKL
jgi:phosphoribosylformylglycinamidine synthase